MEHELVSPSGWPEVDIWATAGTLYFMLTKEYPRDMREDNNYIKMILESDPVPIKQRNIGIPNSLAELVDYALEDKEDLNFKTAIEFKEDLMSVVIKNNILESNE